MNEPENLIGVIKKNAVETLRFTISEFRGRRLLDMRVYYEDADGTWKPTRKGLALRPELVPQVELLLAKAKKMLGNEAE